MRIQSWRAWLSRKLGRRGRVRSFVKTGCLALGLATAWSGEAQSAITFRTEITPAHDLLDAFVYFGNNATGGSLYPLGSLSAGETHHFLHAYPGLAGFSVEDTPEYYEPDGRFPIGFGIGGIYVSDGTYGLTVSYIDTSPIDNSLSWQEFFDFDIGGYSEQTEADIITDYFDELVRAPDHWDRTPLGGLYSFYTGTYNDSEGPEMFRERRLLTPYGSNATLISFGDTRFAGTSMVLIVPEPSSIVIVVLAGTLAAVARRFVAHSSSKDGIE